VLECTYPRLDIEVSKKLNHLLKSPFVVHPGTGRVCVPVDISSDRTLDAFNPLEVPTVQELLGEIDAWSASAAKESAGGASLQDWEKTSLKPYVEYFRSFVVALMKDERDPKVKREREEGANAMEF
jgi:DNA primase small subunit